MIVCGGPDQQCNDPGETTEEDTEPFSVTPTLSTTSPGSGSCIAPPGAPQGAGPGDGVCQAWANTEACNFDGGDCEPDDEVTYYGCQPPIHILIAWIGDGICDQDLNNPQCGYDEGDCEYDEITTTTAVPTTSHPANCNPLAPYMLLWIGK